MEKILGIPVFTERIKHDMLNNDFNENYVLNCISKFRANFLDIKINLMPIQTIPCMKARILFSL